MSSLLWKYKERSSGVSGLKRGDDFFFFPRYPIVLFLIVLVNQFKLKQRLTYCGYTEALQMFD